MAYDSPEEDQPSRHFFIWGLVVVAVLALTGWTIQQVWFNTAVVETSYNTALDIMADPRSPCQRIPGEIPTWECTTPSHVSPDETMSFFASTCDGAGNTNVYDGDHVVVKIPVGQLDAIDRQGKGDSRGDMIVTIRPKVFGLFGDDEVLKTEAAPTIGGPCGHDYGF